MKVCIRPFFACWIASPALRISFSTARANEQTVDSLIFFATALIELKSPGLAAAKPASITSTPSFSSCLAMRNFSSCVIEAPGLCSPSLKVVSKMMSLLFCISCCIHYCLIFKFKISNEIEIP